jgi:ACS family hexuronate transporter-like MFS transporter
MMPLSLPPAPIATAWHWQWVFIRRAYGFLWLLVWARFYRAPEEHPNLSSSERDLILSDKDPPGSAVRVPWSSLLRYRQAWAFLLGKMMTDPVWWFYLAWLPTYLVKQRGVSPQVAALVLIYPYIAADFGSVGGGWLSGFLMKRGWTVSRARFTAMGIAALCMPGAIWAVLTSNLYVALTLISLATAAHQAWSANIFTLASDMFPKQVVGSVVGLGGMAGAIGGMFMQLVAGGVLQSFGTYVPLFVIAGVMHPLALGAITLFAGMDGRQANLEAGPALGANRNLRIAGSLVAIVGAILAAAVLLNWSLIAGRSMSAAAQGLTASIGVALLGFALLYASRERAVQAVGP